MKNIQIKDSNNISIFEGDTILYSSLQNDFMGRSLMIEKLAITHFKAFIVPSENNNIVTTIEIRAYRKDNKPVNIEQYKNYLETTDKEVSIYANDLAFYNKLSVKKRLEDLTFILKSDAYYHYLHHFINQEKTIESSTLTLSEKKEFINDDLMLFVDDIRFPSNTKFLFKLDEKSKKYVTNKAAPYRKPTFGFKGDFTHLEVELEHFNSGCIAMKFKPLNDSGEQNWYISEYDDEKLYDRKERVEKELKEKEKDLLSKKLETTIETELLHKLNIKYNKIKRQNENCFIDILIKDLNIGVASHLDILTFFLRNGSELSVS